MLIERLHQPRDRRWIAHSNRIETIRPSCQISLAARHGFVEACRFVTDVQQIEIGVGVDEDCYGGGAGRLARHPNAVGSVRDIWIGVPP